MLIFSLIDAHTRNKNAFSYTIRAHTRARSVGVMKMRRYTRILV